MCESWWHQTALSNLFILFRNDAVRPNATVAALNFEPYFFLRAGGVGAAKVLKPEEVALSERSIVLCAGRRFEVLEHSSSVRSMVLAAGRILDGVRYPLRGVKNPSLSSFCFIE